MPGNVPGAQPSQSEGRSPCLQELPVGGRRAHVDGCLQTFLVRAVVMASPGCSGNVRRVSRPSCFSEAGDDGCFVEGAALTGELTAVSQGRRGRRQWLGGGWKQAKLLLQLGCSPGARRCRCPMGPERCTEGSSLVLRVGPETMEIHHRASAGMQSSPYLRESSLP